MPDLDWSRLQSFAAVAEHGSLSAAARATGASQPTLSRHIAALEDEIGARLFDRTSEGLALTATGSAICASVSEMDTAAKRIDLIASGRSQEIAGSVRITASETFAAYALPPILTRLRSEEPRIAIELVASNESHNLLRREADIAVRMYRPTQTDVITRCLGEVGLGMFASTSYLEKRGRPKELTDLLQHDVLGYDRLDDMVEGFQQQAPDVKIDRNFFPFRCDALYVHAQMVVAGYGVGLLECNYARDLPGVEQLFDGHSFVSLPIWLTAHAELRTSARVRRVYDFLAHEISARFGNNSGPGARKD